MTIPSLEWKSALAHPVHNRPCPGLCRKEGNRQRSFKATASEAPWAIAPRHVCRITGNVWSREAPSSPRLLANICLVGHSALDIEVFDDTDASTCGRRRIPCGNTFPCREASTRRRGLSNAQAFAYVKRKHFVVRSLSIWSHEA